MERKRITCPETSHLELIDYERTPLGVVIDGCSRFLPRCAVGCSRLCATMMDRREYRTYPEEREDAREEEAEDTLVPDP
ncbi:MAG TPA: hypothetical protein VK932_23505 [Kofleriaceae bacterium]|nr:hypothetical protein [Kofleriaceae bacterium]